MTDNEPIRLSTKPPEGADERVTLFYIDEQAYTIPKRPRANIALQYLDRVREEGTEQGAAWLLHNMLGEDAYDALMGYEYLTPEQLSAIVELCQRHTVGKLEPSNRAERRSKG